MFHGPWMSFCKKRSTLCHSLERTVSLSIFISNEPQNLRLNSGNVLQSDFLFRLLLWAMQMDHTWLDHTWLWWGFCVRSTRSAMFEHSVTTCFSHSLFYSHVFHAWIETSIKLPFISFLMKVSILSVVEITSCLYTKTIIIFNLGE